jgi:hypothetical protein
MSDQSGLANLARAGDNLDETATLPQPTSQHRGLRSDEVHFYSYILLNTLSIFTQSLEQNKA